MRKTNILRTRLVIFLVAGLLVALPALAQIPTGTVTGKVETADGTTRLPGVIVTATSPSLQGQRDTVTGNDGTYRLGFLPPGAYDITFELNDFNTTVVRVRVNAAQIAPTNVGMEVASVEEQIIVLGSVETISETATISTTITGDELNNLPVARNIRRAVELAPGVHSTGPQIGSTRESAITINGAMSFENLWLINGVVVNENSRGQSLNLFIEDAIEETNVSIGSVSAEYGRFTGGVINVLTKSGGNQFSGSLRVSLQNDDWESKTPLTTVEQEDKINEIYEATLGGPIWKDRIWFFLAGRDRLLDTTEQTSETEIAYAKQDDQQRFEGKLTANLSSSHTLTGSYLEVDQAAVNDSFGDILELSRLVTRTDPQDLTAINYHGVFGGNFFAEAQYSVRNLDNGVGSGGERGLYSSPWQTTFDNSAWGEPNFCGNCENEQRDNENHLVKGSYFLSTEGAGSHDIAFGYDSFNSRSFNVNHQSGSDFRLAADDFLIDPNTKEVFTVLDPTSGSNWVAAWPIFGLDNVAKTSFETNSFYVNDRWQLNDKWSFNIGVRHDKNDGRDAGGNLVSDDSKTSPRLGLSYDVKGDGDLVINASWGDYVAALHGGINTANSASTGGATGRAILFYGGPPLNTDPNCVARGDCIPTPEVTRIVTDWWLDETGFNPLTSDPNDIAQIPGVLFLTVPGEVSNVGVRGGISSPSTEELTVGATKRLGTRGIIRADLIFREWEDFYSNKNEVGDTVNIGGTEVDFVELGNFGDGLLKRDYVGANFQGRYRFSNRFTLAGNYTWSELEGNINGETGPNGPISDDPLQYREYRAFPGHRPVGPLGADQEHKLRVWGMYDIVQGDRHNLNVSLLQNFFSGTPYHAEGDVDTRPFVTNPGYVSAIDGQIDYFFTPRGAFTTPDVSSTDIALLYGFRVAKNLELFFKTEVLNVFNEDAVIDLDTQTLDATTGDFAEFNPFTESPIEGTHWGKGDEFGQPQNEFDFQRPRTYRFSVGFRF